MLPHYMSKSTLSKNVHHLDIRRDACGFGVTPFANDAPNHALWVLHMQFVYYTRLQGYNVARYVTHHQLYDYQIKWEGSCLCYGR